MSLGKPEMQADGSPAEEDRFEEIGVGLTEDNNVYVQGEDWELELTPTEARELGQALIDTANDAEQGTE